MNLSPLEISVYSIVEDFIKNDVLFTALDVSNKVKETCLYVRHKEVSSIIRNMWLDHIKSNGYNRTLINVTTSNGNIVEAFLYHPLCDSDDLDKKYDDQKRSQIAAPIKTILDCDTTTSNDTNAETEKTEEKKSLDTNATPMKKAVLSGRKLWDHLFKCHPSLFPHK